ncbi:MAG: alpha/beta fold hydrolase [Hyphomonadaceae bacterium]|nr:alpha/beta fold hydrolase [Hyphomonadaceae bacterium]
MRTVAAFVASLLLAACAVRAENEADADRFPTSRNFSADVMTRVSVTAGGATPWKLSALNTPRAAPAPWKIVVVTGTPSWSEYWAPVLAKVRPDREMVVADRPGFALSEPQTAVTDIAAQADALSALLDGPEDQKVVLIGQSYGGPIAALLAARHPQKVKALVLVSAFYGDRGPTIRRLDALGSLVRPALPRDMKNSLAEINRQAPQLPAARAALKGLAAPVIVLHGDKDTFILPDAAERLAAEAGADYIVAPGGDHFLNACCVDAVLDAVERGIASAEGAAP